MRDCKWWRIDAGLSPFGNTCHEEAPGVRQADVANPLEISMSDELRRKRGRVTADALFPTICHA